MTTDRRVTGYVYALIACLLGFLLASSVLAATDDGSAQGPRVWRVPCGQGVSLSSFLLLASPGDTLLIFGTCHEAVVISTDALRLVGVAGATIDGAGVAAEGVVVIDGARGVRLEDLSIINGTDQGVVATRQAQGTLKGLTIRDNATVGLTLDRSHLDVEDVDLTDNGTGGMDAFTSSTVVLKGTINATGNGGDGLAANGNTFLELRGATVNASDNLGTGVAIINDSRLQIFSFPEAQGSSITADGNGFTGVALLGSELGVVGSPFFGSGANVISAGRNEVQGFWLAAGAILSPHATGRFVAHGNPTGMKMEDGAGVLIVGGLELTDNDTGLDADGAGTLTVVSIPPVPSTITANGTDMALSFGTRATMDGVTAVTVVCDETVLLRGTLACPAPVRATVP